MLVELSAGAGVVDVGVPVNVGELIGAPFAAVMSLTLSVTAPVRELKLETAPAASCAITKAVVANFKYDKR